MRAVLAVVLAGCSSLLGIHDFAANLCAGNTDCTAAQGGECIPGIGGGFCAYPSASCSGEGDTGYAWAPGAGANMGCVLAPPSSDHDAGPVDAPSGGGDGGATECFGNPATFQVCIPSSLAGTTRSFPPANDDHIYSGGQGGNDPITSDCDFAVTQDGVNFCVVAGSAMTFDSEAYIEDPAGTHAIAFVSSDTITIDTPLIANGSLSNDYPGPGSLLGSACTGAAGPNNTTAAGGGAGGGYGTAGGNGGNSGTGAPGGTASPVSATFSTTIRSGCWGGAGGELTGGTVTNPGGYAGGIVYFIAKNGISITSSGYVDVGGGGGAGGGSPSVGGGGGGTGGFVGMDAPSIVVQGFVYARGGAGGGAADVDVPLDIGSAVFEETRYGGFGDNGSSAQAEGGAAGGSGGNGGNGPDTATDSGQPGQNAKADSQAGGGGGAGGNGVIWLVGGATVPSANLVGLVVTNDEP